MMNFFEDLTKSGYLIQGPLVDAHPQLAVLLHEEDGCTIG